MGVEDCGFVLLGEGGFERALDEVGKHRKDLQVLSDDESL